MESSNIEKCDNTVLLMPETDVPMETRQSNYRKDAINRWKRKQLGRGRKPFSTQSMNVSRNRNEATFSSSNIQRNANVSTEPQPFHPIKQPIFKPIAISHEIARVCEQLMVAVSTEPQPGTSVEKARPKGKRKRAVENHKILCFVRHFDTEYQGQREDKYNIVKLYTSEEVTHINSADRTGRGSKHVEMVPAIATTNEKFVDIAPPVGSISQSSHKPLAEKQFSSPTSKMVLDSIGTNTCATEKGDSFKHVTKRRLAFESMGAKSNSADEQKPGSALLQTEGKNQVVHNASAQGQKSDHPI